MRLHFFLTSLIRLQVTNIFFIGVRSKLFNKTHIPSNFLSYH